MPKPVDCMTLEEAHQEYSSLVDKITAAYAELDSGELGNSSTPAWQAKISELAHMYAWVCDLCKRLNISVPATLWRPPHFKH